MPVRIKESFFRFCAACRRWSAATVRETRHSLRIVYFLILDSSKMVDVNDFGRYITRNLGRRFVALSGVVTLFTLVAEYTKHVFYDTGGDVAITDSLLKSLTANFLFFGIPGALLLLATQLFSFFNRFNAYTAQANYLNTVESAKRTPANIDRIIHKLWKSVYQPEFELYAEERSHSEQCEEVEEILRRHVEEEARLLDRIAVAMEAKENGACAGKRDAEARRKYEAHLERDRAEGYTHCLSWDRMSYAERQSAVSRILNEEAVEEIAARNLCFCERGFKHNAAWALATPMHLNFKYARCGIDLKLVEDWMDGAFFDITDIKLIEQYIAEATLRSVKLQARVPLVPFIMIQGLRNFWQRIWSYMALSITAKRIGRYLGHLNLRYVSEENAIFSKDYFKAEAFFWPTDAYDRDVEARIGPEALDRLDALRKRWLFLTLGKLKKPRVHPRHSREKIRHRLHRCRVRAVRSATRIIQRLFAGSVYNIHELRLKYDPDYVLLASRRSRAGFRKMGMDLNYVERHRYALSRRAREVETFQAFLTELVRPEALSARGLKPLDREALRAIRIAHHINENGLKRLVEVELLPGPHPCYHDRIFEIIRDVADRKRSYSRKIKQLAIFETLAVHHLKTYINEITRRYCSLEGSFGRELEQKWKTMQGFAK